MCGPIYASSGIHVCPVHPHLAPHVPSTFLLRNPYYFPYFRLARFDSPTRFWHDFLQDLSCGDPRMCKIGSECAWSPRLEFWHHEVPAVSFRPNRSHSSSDFQLHDSRLPLPAAFDRFLARHSNSLPLNIISSKASSLGGGLEGGACKNIRKFRVNRVHMWKC